MTVYRDICEYSYRELVERCSETEGAMDLVAIASWLEDQIAARVHDFSTEGRGGEEGGVSCVALCRVCGRAGRGMVQ